MSDTQIIVGLEIGTSKICVAVGEVSDNQVVNIIGLGQSKSRGVRKGEIVDASLVEEDVRNAIVGPSTWRMSRFVQFFSV